MRFEHAFKNIPVILTEGAVLERLKYEADVELDEHINHAGLVNDAKEVLSALYMQYVDIALSHDLPIMIMTPTRKVNVETLKKSAYYDREVIADCCTFLRSIQAKYQPFSKKIFLGGLLGCKGNAYRADEALQHSEAYAFHKAQVKQFKDQHLDYLFAGIMPAVSEAAGMAQAMAETGLPYIISFMVRSNGRLLDGTPIAEAIRRIDNAVNPRPICYMANCVHPANLKLALLNLMNRNSPFIPRLMGIQANASSRSPDELDQCGILHQGDYDEDGFITVTDLHFLINVLFGGGPPIKDPDCPTWRGDLDCDGFESAGDLAYMIDHLFVGGPPPCGPQPKAIWLLRMCKGFQSSGKSKASTR